MSIFTKAKKHKSRLRFAISGVSGSGKTYTALKIAQELAGGKPFAVIDTERGSASLYADEFDFDVVELSSFSPDNYTAAIRAAEKEGYEVLVIDSLTHAWSGTDGALEQVDRAAAKSQSNNTYFAWRNVTPKHQIMVDAIVQSRMHLIATMREKSEFVIETVNGKSVPRRVGMQPIQREGIEYEFTVAARMDLDHQMFILKTRAKILDSKVFDKPDGSVVRMLLDWLNSGEAEKAETTETQKDGQSEGNQDAPQKLPPPKNPAPVQTKLTLDELKAEYKALGAKIKADIPNSCLSDIVAAAKLKADATYSEFELVVQALRGVANEDPNSDDELVAKMWPYTRDEIQSLSGNAANWQTIVRMTPLNARQQLFDLRHA